jgi:hypothetical protein
MDIVHQILFYVSKNELMMRIKKNKKNKKNKKE